MPPCKALAGYSAERPVITFDECVPPTRGYKATMRRGGLRKDTCTRCLGTGIVIGAGYGFTGKTNGRVRIYCPDCGGTGRES